MNKSKTLISIIFIFLVAVLLRFLFLSSVPPSLNWDEASLGYNAYSILKTGRDEWGRSFPLTFEAFGDYKLPGYIYSLVPLLAVFGLNEFSVRLLSQLAGVLAVFLVYLICKKLFCSKNVGLLAAFLLAVSPWHVFFSRMALEANYALTLFLLGLWCFLRGLENKKYLIPSALFFGVTIFTYNSARVFIPLFITGLVLFFKGQLFVSKKHLIIPGIILGAFLILAGFLAIFEDSSQRYYWVSIVDQGAINYLNEARSSAHLPEIVEKLVYNRYLYFVQAFVKNYLSHFSIEFLFLKGGSNHQFSIPNTGLLYIFELPFLIYGLFSIFSKKQAAKVILLWLFLAPIPSAITREAPHAVRSIFMLGALQAITAFGLVEIINRLADFKKIYFRSLVVGLILVVAGSLASYYYNYFVNYPRKNSQAFQYGYRQAVEALDLYKDNYPKIYFTKRYGEPHIFYLFFNKYSPAKYQANPTLVRYSKTNWRWVDRIDNIYFLNDWQVKERLKDEKNVLLISSPGTYPPGAKVLEKIYFLDGSEAFDVVAL